MLSGVVVEDLVLVPPNTQPVITQTRTVVQHENAGKVTYSDWLGFDSGEGDAEQGIAEYILTGVTNTHLFTTLPTVGADGSLSFTPAPGAHGNFSFTIAVRDDGGTEHGGEDLSLSEVFEYRLDYLISSTDSKRYVEYQDAAGSNVRIELKGPGTLRAVFEGDTDHLTTLDGHDTDVRSSSVTVTVSNSKAGNLPVFTSIDYLGFNSGLVAFYGSNLHVNSFFSSEYSIVKTVVLGDFVTTADNPGISMAGTPTDVVSITLGRAENINITVGTKLNLTAVEWTYDGENYPFPYVKAYSLGTLNITGRAASDKLAAIAGDFVANVTLTRPDATGASPVTGVINIKGDSTGDWNLGVYKTASITIGGDASGSWKTSGVVGTLTIKGDAAGLLIQSGGVSAVTINGDVAGLWIQSGNITSLLVKGDASKLNISSTGSIGPVNIAGILSDSTWEVKSHAGIVLTGGLERNHLVIGGNLSGLNTKAGAIDSDLIVGGTASVIYAKTWMGGELKAGIAPKITIPGDVDAQMEFDRLGELVVGGKQSGSVHAITLANLISVNEFTGTIRGAGAKLGTLAFNRFDGKINAAGGNVNSLLVRTALTSLEVIADTAGSINVPSWTAGALTLKSKLTTLTVKNDMSAAVTLGTTLPGAHPTALTTGSVGGMLSGNWTTYGTINTLNAGAISKLVVQGHEAAGLNALVVKGEIADTHLLLDGIVTRVSAVRWDRGSVIARKFLGLTLTGKAAAGATPAVSGDLTNVEFDVNTLALTGGTFDPTQNYVNSVSIAGVMSNAYWQINGSAGTFSVGSMDSSQVRVGISPVALPNAMPEALRNFSSTTTAGVVKRSTLAGFTVTGRGVPAGAISFKDSIVAAGTLTRVSLQVVSLEERTYLNGFVAAAKVGSYTRLTNDNGSSGYVQINQKSAAGRYDPSGPAPRNGPAGPGVESGYVLKIVGE